MKKHTETLDSKLRSTWQIINRMYNTEASAYEFSTSMAMYLLNVDSVEGINGNELAPKLGMEGTSLSRITNSLEEKGYIKREQGIDFDKRKIKIKLTEQGKEAKEIAKNVVRNFNTMVEKELGSDNLSKMFELLDKVAVLADERNNELKKSKLYESNN